MFGAEPSDYPLGVYDQTTPVPTPNEMICQENSNEYQFSAHANSVSVAFPSAAEPLLPEAGGVLELPHPATPSITAASPTAEAPRGLSRILSPMVAL